MRLIPLTQNRNAIIDDDLFDEINQYVWYFNCGYAVRNITDKEGKRNQIRMHRHIFVANDSEQVDHINRNKLDNRKSNLRSVTQQENFWNTALRATNKSGYKGVHFHKLRKVWIAQIRFNGKAHHLGCFKSKEKAALAYNEAAKSMRKGEITYLNPVSS